MTNLQVFGRSWTPGDAFNEKGENLALCADSVSQHTESAKYFLRVAEDDYAKGCPKTGGSGYSVTEVTMKLAKNKANAAAALRGQQVWDGRKKRFVDLLKTHTQLLTETRTMLNNNIDTNNKFKAANRALVDACGKIDDILYLLQTSQCNN
jgi:hypothetical protein